MTGAAKPTSDPKDADARQKLRWLANEQINFVAQTAVAKGHELENLVVFVVDADDSIGKSVARVLLRGMGKDLDKETAAMSKLEHRIVTSVITRREASALFRTIKRGGEQLNAAIFAPAPTGTFYVAVFAAHGAAIVPYRVTMPAIGSA